MHAQYNEAAELVEPLRAAEKRSLDADTDWAEAKLAYARLLLEARRAQPGDREFGLWLAANQLDGYGHQDRAAFLKIAEHPDLFREMAAESGRRSVQLIWHQEMQPRFTNASKAEVTPAAPVLHTDSGDPTRSRPAISDPKIVISAKELSRTPLKDMPRFETVLTHVRQSDTRTMIARTVHTRRGGRAAWDLLLYSIDSGAFGPPTEANVTEPNLRMVLPWLPLSSYVRRFNLLEKDSVLAVRNEIIPFVLEESETLRRDPSQLETLVNARMKRRLDAARAVEEAKRHTTAVAQLPTTEKEIVMYGKVFWPSPLFNTKWTYTELLEACWFFQMTKDMLMGISKGTQHPQAIMQMINALMKWQPLRASGFAEAVRALGWAYHEAPEGECRRQPAPPNFGLGG